MTEADVLANVKNVLMLLEKTGDIIWWERLATGRIKTEYGSWMQLCRKGTPDVVVVIRNRNNWISIMFVECKSSTGTLRGEQKDFKEKMSREPDVYYEVVTDHRMLVKRILDIAKDRLSAIDF